MRARSSSPTSSPVLGIVLRPPVLCIGVYAFLFALFALYHLVVFQPSRFLQAMEEPVLGRFALTAILGVAHVLLALWLVLDLLVLRSRRQAPVLPPTASAILALALLGLLQYAVATMEEAASTLASHRTRSAEMLEEASRLEAGGREAEACALYEEAWRVWPEHLEALRGLAWLRATGAEGVADPDQALSASARYSEAVALHGEAVDPAAIERLPREALEVQAAALARSGATADAAQMQERAVALAERTGASADALSAMRERLACYRSGKPWTATAPR